MITIIGRKEVSTEEGFGWGVLEGPCLELQKQNPAIIASVYLSDDKRIGTVPLHYHFPTTSGLTPRPLLLWSMNGTLLTMPATATPIASISVTTPTQDQYVSGERQHVCETITCNTPRNKRISSYIQ